MDVLKTENDVKESISRKLSGYSTYYRDDMSERDYSSTGRYTDYEAAKKAGDVTAMIGHKMKDADARARKQDVISLSNEYSKLSIVDIQKRLPVAKSVADKAKDIVDRMYNAELDRVTKEYQKTIGGLQNEALARGKAIEAVDEWAKTDEEFLKATDDYAVAKREHTALSNAKAMYIEENKDLIEMERKIARRNELLASGILAEMGIKGTETE